MALKKHSDNLFGEDICRIVDGGTKDEGGGAINNLFTGVVILYLNVLRLGMEHWVKGDNDTALIVTQDGGGSCLAETCVKQLTLESGCLASSIAYGAVLNLSGRESHCGLVFVGPRDGGRPEGKHSQLWSDGYQSRLPSPSHFSHQE